MSTWDHRILAQADKDAFWFVIHEVHYDEDGKPTGYTENGTDVSAETIEGLRWVLKGMEISLKKPILWSGDRFPEEWIRPADTKQDLLNLIVEKIQIYHVHRNHFDLGSDALITDFYSEFTLDGSVIIHYQRRHIKYSEKPDDYFFIEIHMDRLEKFTIYKEEYSETDYDFVIKLEGKNIKETRIIDPASPKYDSAINYADEKWFYMSAVNRRNNVDENLQNTLETALNRYLEMLKNS